MHSIAYILILATCLSLLPQIYKTAKTKSSNDISIVGIIYFDVLHTGWTIYNAYGLPQSIVYLCNSSFLLFLSIVLTILVFKYRK